MAIDKILKKYKDLRTKTLKKRIEGFEKFHAPDNIEKQQLVLYSGYIVTGSAEDKENYPGALNKAHALLGKEVKEDNAKVDDTDLIARVLETYVDECLSKILGQEALDEFIEGAKEEGLDEKQVRAAKGSLLSQHIAYGDKSIPNILEEKYITKLKGKKKIELIGVLKFIGKHTAELYGLRITDEVEDLFTLDDHFKLAKHVSSKFKKAGLSHKEPHLTRSMENNKEHYRLFLTGETKALVEKHEYKYEPVKKEKKE